MRTRGNGLRLGLPRVVAACFAMGATLPFAASASAIGGPVNLTPPSISGSAVQGQTLTCSPGTWTPAPTGYSYSWQRDVVTTLASGGNTYTVGAADVGHAITCSAVASDSLGSSLPAVSVPPVIPTAAQPAGTLPVEVSPPVISGTAEPGQTVSCSTGAWLNSPTAYAYSWQRDGTNIVSQTSGSYTLTSPDANHVITCTVVASNAAGSSAPAISPPVVPLVPPVGLVPVGTTPPAISGSAVEGHTVACSPGDWLNSPTSYTYAWQRDALAIAGQTAGQYTLTSTDVGQAITCTVVAHNASGDSLPAISAPVIPALGSIVGGGGQGGGSSGGGSGGGPSHGGGSGGVKRHPPTLRSFWVAPGKVVVVVRGKRRSTKGTTFHYSLDQRAEVLIELQRRVIGRLHGRTCAAANPHNRRAKPCARWVTVKVLRIKSAKPGSDKLKFAGRADGRLLATGAYRAYAAAVSAEGWSKVRSTSLTVVAKPAARRPRRQNTDPHRHK